MDLPRYGSQVLADRNEVPPLSEIIRWIEVDIPVRFLPQGVNLLGTPGLGSLYAAHAQITYRFVPHADAVIFVLDSEKQILQTELEFIEILLGVTRKLLFIQTKIDLFGKQWEDIYQRNLEILKPFQDRLVDLRIWPVSSQNLLKAAQAPSEKSAEALLMVSRHRQLAAALQAFLTRVSGWARSAEAILLASHYHTSARQTLAARLKILTEEAKSKRDQVQQQARARKEQFETAWGKDGQQRKALSEGIQKALTVAKQGFKEALQTGGAIEETQRNKINEATTLAEAKALGETLSGEIIAASLKLWQEACQTAHQRCLERLGPFLSAADGLLRPEETSISGLTVRDQTAINLENLLWKKVKGARWEALQAAGMVGAASTGVVVAGAVLGTVIAWPIIPLASAAAGLWGWLKGWRNIEAQELESVKRKLREHLAEVLRQVQRYYSSVDLAAGQYSRADEYFRALETLMTEQIQAIASQKLTEAQAELERLTREAELDEQQRRSQALEVREQLAAWDRLGSAIKKIMEQLNALEQALASATAPTVKPEA